MYDFLCTTHACVRLSYIQLLENEVKCRKVGVKRGRINVFLKVRLNELIP